MADNWIFSCTEAWGLQRGEEPRTLNVIAAVEFNGVRLKSGFQKGWIKGANKGVKVIDRASLAFHSVDK